MSTFPAKTSDRRPRAGFTLIELIIVLSLLTVMMLLVAPTFQNLLQSNLQQEVNRLTGVIRLLRNEAVLTHTRFRLVVDLAERGYRVEERDRFGDWVPRGHPAILRAHRFPEAFVLRDLQVLGAVARTERETELPIAVDSSGYVDPFLLRFSTGGQAWSLRAEGFTGRLHLVSGHEEE